MMQRKTTHFGFNDVAEDEKKSLVHDVFATVSSKYDLMNNVMSLGVHHQWKRTLISMMNPQPHTTLLDVAGGTGDIAFRFLDATHDNQVTVCDINDHMLQAGVNNAIDNNYLKDIQWVCGNAESLPCEDMQYDYYTIAFGIRNVTHIDQALKEAYRVLKPGGRFLCLEFSHVENPLLAPIYKAYSFNVIPQLGKLFAGDAAPYQYLVESICKFPPQEQFSTMIKEAGFDRVSYRNLNSGICAIHSGWRL